MSAGDDRSTRRAACACGAVQVTAEGPPAVVNACACLDCQRRSGSAFTYSAFFPAARVQIVQGGLRTYREVRAAGRWHEGSVCVVCGVAVVSRLEVFPDFVGVAVGCFADPAFEPPSGFYWASRRHAWLLAPTGVRVLDTQ